MRRLISWMVCLAAFGAIGCQATLHAEVSIPAPRARVWEVLTDFEHYEEWNPFLVRARGVAEVGTKLDLTMQPVGKKSTDFSPKVLVVEPERRLEWRGRLGVPGLFDGRHSFVLEQRGDEVHVIQHEDFSGMLVSFVGYEPYRLGFERMNAALRERAMHAAEAKLVRADWVAWPLPSGAETSRGGTSRAGTMASLPLGNPLVAPPSPWLQGPSRW